jgi:tRNA nucleotidyltransferase (CCA-adding enzyme)
MYKDILKRIKPSKKEEAQMKKVFKSISSSIKIPKTTIELGGSSAKGTWLKGNHDIDIYIKFDQKYYSGMNISEFVHKAKPKASRVHGSRDYFQMVKDGFEIELIPIMNIKKVEHADNITDISPFHKKWVKKHKQYTSDIRLAKAFAKANGFYGAESYIRGFSGYAMEVLTIHYKGFDKMLKNVANWKTKTTIDPEKYHKGKIELNKAKMLSPLIVIDPVQATRNMTAVVSKEKYKLFIKSAKRFLKKPNEKYFIKPTFSLEELKKRKKDKKLITIEIEPLEGKRDVIGAKILKSFEYIKKELHNNSFFLKDAGWNWDENALLWFILEEQKLSTKVKHFGPPQDRKKRVKHFKEKWKGKRVKIEEGVTYVMVERKYKKAEHLTKEIILQEYIDSRVSKVLDHKVH